MPSDPTPLSQLVIARFRAAQTPEELARLFDPPARTPRAEVESLKRTLRELLGDGPYERLVKRAKASRGGKRAADRPNVVVLPGVMGSELSVGEEGSEWKLWVNYWWIYRGHLPVLKLSPSGTAPAGGVAHEPISATGLLNEYYADIVFQLGESCNVRAFPYDWRLPLAKSAEALQRFITEHFTSGRATLVAHSMGGLVARALMAQSQVTNAGGGPVERLVMLGTPNYGSFEVPQIFAGIQQSVKDLVRLTAGVGGFVSSSKKQAMKAELLHVLGTFPALYQMLPVDNVPGLGPSATRRQLYNPDIYRSFNDAVSGAHFKAARTFQQSIASVIDPARMVYVAGYNQETVTGVLDPGRLDAYDSYEITLAGDGKVPHALGLLAGVPTYFVDCPHADLPKHEPVLRVIEDLARGKSANLPTSLPTRSRSLGDTRALGQAWALKQAEKDREDDERMQKAIAELPPAAAARNRPTNPH